MQVNWHRRIDWIRLGTIISINLTLISCAFTIIIQSTLPAATILIGSNQIESNLVESRSLLILSPYRISSRLVSSHPSHTVMSVPPTPSTPIDEITPNYCTAHFVTGTYNPTTSFVDDETYAKCLDTLVKACNDMLLTYDGKVFLGKRQMWPQRDWWYGCGGRMKPGETVFESSRRLLQRELKLDISVEDLKKRLQSVGHYSFV